jgi:glycosyltransferase involved in cell wall biosynthesis
MAKEKIMYMTDAVTTTGFGIVADNVCKGLVKKGYEVYLLGWGFRFEKTINRNGYTLIPTGQHPCGADVLPQMLQTFKPEIFITQADSRMLGGDGDNWLPNILRSVPNKPTWIYYPVIDGHVWDVDNKQTKWAGNWTTFMKQADKVIGMTKFGQNILKENGIDAGCIYHGVDGGMFKPFPDEARNQIKKGLGLDGKFVVGGIFKNMGRKNPDKYLQAMKYLKKLAGDEAEKVVLFLQTNPNPQMGGEFNLPFLAADYGLEVNKDVRFGQMGIPYEQMPALYNLFDAFLVLGGMEGFNLPTIEAMSCGVPVVALDCEPHREILGDTGLFIKHAKYDGSDAPATFGSYNGIECFIPDAQDAAKKLLRIMREKLLREKLSFEATVRAVKVFDWNVIVDAWDEEIKKHIFNPETLPAEWQELYAQTTGETPKTEGD